MHLERCLSIIDIVISLGERGIPFRGNWVKEPKTEEGNFAFFVNYKSKYDIEQSYNTIRRGMLDPGDIWSNFETASCA